MTRVTKPAWNPLVLLLAFGVVCLLGAFLVQGLWDPSTDPKISAQIFWELRLPRLITALAVGAGLGISGAVLQVIFSNPLCEPYTLGISSGSAVGAVLGAWLGLPGLFFGMTGSAFLGALLFSLILIGVSRRNEGSASRLLLSGVALGFLGSSIVALVMAMTSLQGIQGALLWLLGDFSRSQPQGAVVTFVGVALLMVWIQRRAHDLDALLLGDLGARSLGFDPRRIRFQMTFAVASLVALCVSTAGMIGFVGLLVPHAARRWVGSRHRFVLPLAAVLGALALALSDGLARWSFSPIEIPVGVVTALWGSPLFIFVMRRSNGLST